MYIYVVGVTVIENIVPARSTATCAMGMVMDICTSRLELKRSTRLGSKAARP